MRTFIAVLITLAVVGGGFGLYLKFASPDVKGKQRARKQPTDRKPIATRPTDGFGEGRSPWWEQYDEKGRRTSRIQAEYYEPLKDGKYKVVAPRVDFFQNNGEVLRIEGRTGTITMQQGLGRSAKVSAGGSAGSSANQTPRSGELKGVTIYVLPSLARDARPTLTLTMDNASFDNETYKVRTEAFEAAAGGSVPWDEVPVSVRGDEYDFDGRGLELQYNEVDKRLEYLRVVHGQKLLIKHPAKFMKAAEKREGGAATRPTTRPVNPAEPMQTAGVDLVQHVILAADQPDKAGNKERKAEKAAKAAREEGAAAETKKQDRPKLPATLPSTRPAETVYRASFQENVLILQGGRQLASVHELQVDFIGEEGGVSATGPKAAPAEKSGKAPRAAKIVPRRQVKAQKAAARAKKQARAQRAAAAAPATGPAVASREQGGDAAPSTQPADEPIEVRWTGPLVVTPVLKDRPDKLRSGESIVRMIARPGEAVSLTKPKLTGETTQTMLQAARLTHWTMDQSALLEGAEGIPVRLDELKEGRRTEIITQRMHFLPEQGMALLEGRSSARLPVEDESRGPATRPATRPAEPQYLSAQWAERCIMYFEGKDVEDMVVKQADLRGAVAVDHAQLQMNAETLSLKFAAPATQPTTRPSATTKPSRAAPVLTELDAAGKVHAVVRKEGVAAAAPGAPATRPAAGVQVIDCDRLQMATAAGAGGKLYPRTIIADGKVRAVDSERDLEAGNIKLTLKQPATRPAGAPAVASTPKKSNPADFDTGDLEHMLATQHVRITTADGKRAEAESLEIADVEGKSTVILRGKPDAPAVVVREKDRLVGPEIRFSPQTQEFAVLGAGRMDGEHRETAGGPGLPVAVTWNNNVIGRDNVISADGGVRASSTDSDGANNSATAQRVSLATAPKPATRPATQPALARKPTTKPSDLDVMANRDITGISLEGGAETRSELFDKAGRLLRLVQLKSDRIHWSQEPGKGRRLSVPGAGTMLVVDERDPAKDKAAQEAAKDPLGVRGRTAFSWHDSLTYDELKKQVEMKGNVEVGRLAYKPQTRPADGAATKPAVAEEPMRLYGDRILADIDEPPARKPATNPAAQPAKNAGPLGMGSDFSAKMQFKKVTVEGNVAVQGGKINIQAATITYEPALHRLTARGTARNPVRQFDKDGLEEARFDSVVLDTETGHVLDSRGMVITRRK